jgi:hypothetical protein
MLFLLRSSYAIVSWLSCSWCPSWAVLPGLSYPVLSCLSRTAQMPSWASLPGLPFLGCPNRTGSAWAALPGLPYLWLTCLGDPSWGCPAWVVLSCPVSLVLSRSLPVLHYLGCLSWGVITGLSCLGYPAWAALPGLPYLGLPCLDYYSLSVLAAGSAWAILPGQWAFLLLLPGSPTQAVVPWTPEVEVTKIVFDESLRLLSAC